MAFIFTIQVRPENGPPEDIRAVDARMTAADLALTQDEFTSRYVAPMVKALLKHLSKEAA
jgi:hypothetical protein